MKMKIVLAGAVLAATGLPVLAANPADVLGTGESFEQRCGRWAGYQGLVGDARNEYLADCTRELRLPDPEAADDDD